MKNIHHKIHWHLGASAIDEKQAKTTIKLDTHFSNFLHSQDISEGLQQNCTEIRQKIFDVLVKEISEAVKSVANKYDEDINIPTGINTNFSIKTSGGHRHWRTGHGPTINSDINLKIDLESSHPIRPLSAMYNVRGHIAAAIANAIFDALCFHYSDHDVSQYKFKYSLDGTPADVQLAMQ